MGLIRIFEEIEDKGSYLLVAGIITVLGAIIYSGYKFERKIFSIKDMTERVLYKAAGEDKILDTAEKARLIRNLGLDYVIQDGENLYFDIKRDEFYLKANSNSMGQVNMKVLENYLSGDLKVERND